MDINRIVEAHGGAEVLDALKQWAKLGYDLDLGRDLTNEEAAQIKQVTILGNNFRPCSPDRDGFAIIRSGSSDKCDAEKLFAQSLTSPIPIPLHQSPQKPEEMNETGNTAFFQHPGGQENDLPLELAEINTSNTSIKPPKVPQMQFLERKTGEGQVPARLKGLDPTVLTSAVNAANTEHHEPALHTVANTATREDSETAVELQGRKSSSNLHSRDRCRCRIDERVYILPDGRRSVFQD